MTGITISEPLHRALDQLCTASLLDQFGAYLVDAAARLAKLSPQARLELIYNAFARLWWSEEVRLYLRNDLVLAVVRDEHGNHSRAHSAESEVLPRLNEFLFVRAVGNRRCAIDINLSRLEDVDTDATARLFGVDRVIVVVRLFQVDGRERQRRHIVRRFGRQVAEQLRRAVRVAEPRILMAEKHEIEGQP